MCEFGNLKGEGSWWWGRNVPDMSSISTCVAWRSSASLVLRPASVTPESSAMMKIKKRKCVLRLGYLDPKLLGS